MPTREHSQSPSNYESGHCEVARHERCVGVYAGITCTCTCHTTPPQLELDQPPAATHCPTCTCGGVA